MRALAALVLILACSATYGRARADEVTPVEATPEIDPAALPVETPPQDAGSAPPDSTDPAPAEETPTREVAPPQQPVAQATDSERVPMSRSERTQPVRPAEPVTQSDELASPIPPPPDPLAGRRYPESASRRPLTLAEGVWRLDHVIDWNVMAFAVEAPNTLSAGVTNDVELGVAWPWTRDPTLFGTVRFFTSDVVDLGVRAAVRVPAVTTGDTVVRASIPVVLRPTRHVRIQTGVDVELLLTPQISPWAWIPLQIMGNPVPSMFLGAQGSLGLLEGERWTGQIGLFVGHTVSATPTGHPIFEIRWTTSYMFELNDVHITCAASFFPRFW
ncbi:MAG: hypothetical protein J0L92_01605 [Deltaproteobacteria bacterium]|nr:hypothetical protein [Deltaproteobacteria bacterium]